MKKILVTGANGQLGSEIIQNKTILMPHEKKLDIFQPHNN